MSDHQIAIAGGGLADLYASHILIRQGFTDVVLLACANEAYQKLKSSKATRHMVRTMARQKPPLSQQNSSTQSIH